MLNQLAAWWFEHTRDIVSNHLLEVPDPNVTIGRAANPLPVEVVVRVHHGRHLDVAVAPVRRRRSHDLRLRLPRRTAEEHDAAGCDRHPHHEGAARRPRRADHLRRRGVRRSGGRRAVDEVQAVALALFARGRAAAERAGLVLADTKYEFGLAVDTGELLLIDEVHTPDSSRYWVADSYEARLAAGDEPESLDKELVRRALIDLGYDGDGDPPTLPAEVIAAASSRYASAYERLTGQAFVPGATPIADRIRRHLAPHLARAAERAGHGDPA
ncbi:MAG: phosphoribosylaminoimidazolesuccinocarboxamide synthase [Ilumatobacteraceae bacterium]